MYTGCCTTHRNDRQDGEDGDQSCEGLCVAKDIVRGCHSGLHGRYNRGQPDQKIALRRPACLGVLDQRYE